MEGFQRYIVYNTKTHSQILEGCNQGHLGITFDVHQLIAMVTTDCFMLIKNTFLQTDSGNASLINSEDLLNQIFNFDVYIYKVTY